MVARSEPTASEGEWVFHDGEGPCSGWLYRFADGTLVTEDGTVLEEVTAAAEQHPEPEPEPVPTYVRWDTSAAGQYVAGAVGVVTTVAAVLLLIRWLSATDDSGMLVTAAGLALLAAAAFLGVTALAPSTVTIRDATVTVTRGESEASFDLTHPDTRVDLHGNPWGPSWRATLRAGGTKRVVRRTQVQPRPFIRFVEHHLAARETPAAPPAEGSAAGT